MPVVIEQLDVHLLPEQPSAPQRAIAEEGAESPLVRRAREQAERDHHARLEAE